MFVTLHQLAALLYLGAGLGAGAALALRQKALTRASLIALGLGFVAHGLSFSQLHNADPPPPLTDTATAVSVMAWIGVLGYLLLLWRSRIAGLVVFVAPMAFVGVFYASLRLPAAAVSALPPDAGGVPHAHVLLASGGLGLLGLAGLAGGLFLLEHRRLKRHLPMGDTALPSLEALDRVNALGLSLGFLLLTLGVVTGALWVQTVHGQLWTGSTHETWSILAWGIYGLLVALRFGAHQGARQCAISAVVGFVFASFAVLGAGWIA